MWGQLEGLEGPLVDSLSEIGFGLFTVVVFVSRKVKSRLDGQLKQAIALEMEEETSRQAAERQLKEQVKQAKAAADRVQFVAASKKLKETREQFDEQRRKKQVYIEQMRRDHEVRMNGEGSELANQEIALNYVQFWWSRSWLVERWWRRDCCGDFEACSCIHRNLHSFSNAEKRPSIQEIVFLELFFAFFLV